ncbi:conjugal transfer protein [Pseudomonas oryzihabitans]|nr:conjugal transfer protein [Pseudomonas psychrotolerans]
MGLFERLRGRKAVAADTSVAVEAEGPHLAAVPDPAEPVPEAGLSAAGDPSATAPHPESIRATRAQEVDEEAAYQRYLDRLKAHGIPEPGSWMTGKEKPATVADVARLYDVNPSFTNLLPWVEYLPEHQAMLLEDGKSLAAFFDLVPIGTEGRDPDWLRQARDALENALQDSLDELEVSPWVVQFYAYDEIQFDTYLDQLRRYVHPRAQGTAFTELYLSLMKHHLSAISKPGGLFEDKVVSKLPWRGQQRRVRLVVSRRSVEDGMVRGQDPALYMSNTCERLVGALANAGVRAVRMDERAVRHWLLQWFNPCPDHLGTTRKDHDRFFELVNTPVEAEDGTLPVLASGTDFSQCLFYREPRSDAGKGIWFFDGQPTRVIMLDRLREAPKTGHLTGETRKGGDALNALMDKLPEDTVLAITLVITPQDTLEAHLNQLHKKSVGDNQASALTREAIQDARYLIGRKHKLYKGSVAFYVRGKDEAQLTQRCMNLTNTLMGAGMEPVQPDDEVAGLSSYLRWLPANFDPNQPRALEWYAQMLLVQHVANLAPVWGRHTGTGHPGTTLFNRGGAPLTFDPFNKLDRQMNAHGFIFGPTGSGKSATLNNLLCQWIALYRPRVILAEAGNSFGLLAEFAKKLGLTVNKVRLAPGSGISLAPFADAIRLYQEPNLVKVRNADDLEASDDYASTLEDDQRDILGEMEIVARLMITGGEAKEDARMLRPDRAAIRHAILAAAETCAKAGRTVLTQDIRDALREAARDEALPMPRRERLQEMAESMDMFCMGVDGEMFNRPGTPWPEADITIVDFATFAREGYSAQLGIAYISLLNAVNNIAERDQFSGRPIIMPNDEGHIFTKHELLLPYVVKITKMWRKLGAWYWLATQNIDDIPSSGKPMLNMMEWWICLNMPPDEVEKISQFRSLTPAQKTLMLSARKESGKFTEGVVLSKSMEVLFRAVPPSLYLALAMTESEEKAQRGQLMREHGVDELGAALMIAEDLDRKRGIEPFRFDLEQFRAEYQA